MTIRHDAHDDHIIVDPTGMTQGERDELMPDICDLMDEQATAIARNMTAMATMVGRRMGLPEGYTLEYR